MRKILLYGLPLGLIISLFTLFSNNSYSQQTSTVKTSISSKQTSSPKLLKSSAPEIDDDSYEDTEDVDDDNVNFTSSSTQISDNTNIQSDSINISAANRRQPHILKINSGGAKIRGTIKINGKIVRRLNGKQSQINLSPYLTRGQKKVEISGNYTPATASVKVEMNSTDNNIIQQTSGDGNINYTLNLNVE